MGTPWYEIPPTAYGGIESVCADLVDGLVERGHIVTLVAAGQSRTTAQVVLQTYPQPQGERVGQSLPEVVHAARAARLLAGRALDLVHDHSTAGPLLAGGRRVPTVVTAHGPSTGDHGDYYAALSGSVELVAISSAQRALAPDLDWLATVHNGIQVRTYPYGERKGDHAVFLGRASREKGAHNAIDAARAAGVPLVLAGKCVESVERQYFDAEIAPRLGPDAHWVGEADARQKRELLEGARCLLMPVEWDEPFGMVMVEALACGTPVVGLRRGSVPEIVRHGLTGILCDDLAELPDALLAVTRIDPAECRADALRRFDASVMTSGYEAAYQLALDRHAGLRGRALTR